MHAAAPEITSGLLPSTREKVKSTLPIQNIRIIVESDAIEICADPLLEKVFHNLIDNALRYGGPGMTTIRISSKEIPAGLVVLLEDDGAGISPKDKEHLLKRGLWETYRAWIISLQRDPLHYRYYPTGNEFTWERSPFRHADTGGELPV